MAKIQRVCKLFNKDYLLFWIHLRTNPNPGTLSNIVPAASCRAYQSCSSRAKWSVPGYNRTTGTWRSHINCSRFVTWTISICYPNFQQDLWNKRPRREIIRRTRHWRDSWTSTIPSTACPATVAPSTAPERHWCDPKMCAQAMRVCAHILRTAAQFLFEWSWKHSSNSWAIVL